MGRGRRTGRGNRYLRDGELREAGLRAILLATDRDRYSGSRGINLTGDYHWRRDGGLRNRKLRPPATAFAPPATLPSRAIFYEPASDPLE
jgi:hypothetical protein